MLTEERKNTLETAMDEQIALLENDMNHRFDKQFTFNPFTLNRVVNIWKMLREDPTAWDGSPRMRMSDTSPWMPDTPENRKMWLDATANR